MLSRYFAIVVFHVSLVGTGLVVLAVVFFSECYFGYFF